MGKKEIRQNFRNVCLKRDKYKCVKCTFKSTPEKAEDELDVHHIINRNELPNGGYVLQNGISLCNDCHVKAEHFHSTGVALPGYSIEELYIAIGSNYELAVAASEKLK
jgi:5-methylcytosine-specific restriction endonuclease McrA